MSDVTAEQVADSMFELIKSVHGKKNLKPMDVTKAMIEKFGAEKVDKKLCKEAIRKLIDTGRCMYSYVGGSYIVLPPDKA